MLYQATVGGKTTKKKKKNGKKEGDVKTFWKTGKTS